MILLFTYGLPSFPNKIPCDNINDAALKWSAITLYEPIVAGVAFCPANSSNFLIIGWKLDESKLFKTPSLIAITLSNPIPVSIEGFGKEVLVIVPSAALVCSYCINTKFQISKNLSPSPPK